MDEANSLILTEITRFLSNDAHHHLGDSIPTAFVLAGADTTSHATFFQQLSYRINDSSSQILVTLRSSEGPNLKPLLKSLIQNATIQDEEWIPESGGIRLLDYDLELLHLWLKAQGKDTVAVAFEDSEAFPPAVLAEIIELFGYV